MQLILYATEIIEGKTYTTAKSTIDAKNCRAPMDAESVMTKFLLFADESFERVRKELRK
jgi:hypothetical protein